MAPSKFQIYVDQSLRQSAPTAPPPAPPNQHHQQPVTTVTTTTTTATAVPTGGHLSLPTSRTDKNPRYIRENLEGKDQRFYFDERKLYPIGGGEYSFEELNYFGWIKRQKDLALKRHCDEVERENDELRQKLEAANQQLTVLANALKQIQLQQQQQQQQQLAQIHTQTATMTMTTGSFKPQSPPTNRLSIVPQSLQPAQGGLEYVDMSCCETLNEGVSVVQDCWKNTLASDKFTVPIDQSQYIRENIPTSTPTSKDDKSKRPIINRRMSRPSMAGSPTLKLSPITETSRDCNSKSSSSSSAMSTTPGTAKKPLVVEPLIIDEPDRPLDPNDPTTYRKLLKMLAEPLDRRSGFIRIKGSLPEIKNRACFGTGADNYLVDKELSKESKTFSAQVLTDDSDTSTSDIPMKAVCFRVDQPPNEWLFYICNELHRRCQKTKPDIELSVMNADPAIMYSDGSILIDEYFRFVSLEDYFVACAQMNKPFPKSVGAYVTLEMIQLVRGMHNCDIVHMNINPKNIIITGYPNREDIESVDKRTSLVKLIGFDYAIDIRLLPADFKFKTTLEHMTTCEMLDSKPWSFEVDWYGVLNCIHRMFFLEQMDPVKEDKRWQVKKQFNGFPTDVWNSLFDELLNINDLQATTGVIDRAIDELSTWIKANISFVLREAANLEIMLEDFCRETNRSVRI